MAYVIEYTIPDTESPTPIQCLLCGHQFLKSIVHPAGWVRKPYPCPSGFICEKCEQAIAPTRNKIASPVTKSAKYYKCGKTSVLDRVWMHPRLHRWLKDHPIQSFAKVTVTYIPKSWGK